MNKDQNRKLKLYELYSQNLSWVKENPSLKFEPDFEEGYICPLCFNVFTKDALNKTSLNPLTFDHNPPSSLGGKHGILTCRDCNSKAGYKIDNHLLLQLKEWNFFSNAPNSKIRATLNNDGSRVAADMSVEEDGRVRINVDGKNSNPVHKERFFANRTNTYKAYDPFLEGHDMFDAGTSWKINFGMEIHPKSNERYGEIALLKIAYLLAFQKLGHGFLINPNLYKIREQILNPEKPILPKVFWLKYDFPEKFIGLNIVNNPKELQCFLIIFDLFSNGVKKQFAIALPGLSHPGLKIYENIEAILCQNKEGSSHLNIEHLYNWDYVTKKKWRFASHSLWRNIVIK